MSLKPAQLHFLQVIKAGAHLRWSAEGIDATQADTLNFLLGDLRIKLPCKLEANAHRFDDTGVLWIADTDAGGWSAHQG